MLNYKSDDVIPEIKGIPVHNSIVLKSERETVTLTPIPNQTKITPVLMRQDEQQDLKMYAYPVMSKKPEFKYMVTIEPISIPNLTQSEADELIGGLMALLKRKELKENK
jgi:hypothetical protein